jgi:flagellin-specific chaperone FliS
MQYQLITNKYKDTEGFSETFAELMIKVLEKTKNHLIEAKKCKEEGEYIEKGKHIIIIVNILEVLCRSITVKEDIPGSAETFTTYERLMYLIEKLVATDAPATEFDYFIDYFEKMKQIWVNLNNQQNAPKNEHQVAEMQKTENSNNQVNFEKTFEFIV